VNLFQSPGMDADPYRRSTLSPEEASEHDRLFGDLARRTPVAPPVHVERSAEGRARLSFHLGRLCDAAANPTVQAEDLFILPPLAREALAASGRARAASSELSTWRGPRLVSSSSGMAGA